MRSPLTYVKENRPPVAAAHTPLVQFLDSGPLQQHLLRASTQRVTFNAEHDNW